MSNFIENKTNDLVKLGRPSVNRTTKEQKEFLKLRSRVFYNDAEQKEKQRIRMALYRIKNRSIINDKKRKKNLRTKLEKKLKKIWTIRGFIN